MGFVELLQRRCQQAVISQMGVVIVIYVLVYLAYREAFSPAQELLTILQTNYKMVAFLAGQATWDSLVTTFTGGQDIGWGILGRLILVFVSVPLWTMAVIYLFRLLASLIPRRR